MKDRRCLDVVVISAPVRIAVLVASGLLVEDRLAGSHWIAQRESALESLERMQEAPGV